MYYAQLLSLSLLTARAMSLSWPVQSYVTEDLHPPVLVVNKTGPTANGYLFFGAEGENTTTIEPLIMTDGGELIWQSERPATNLTGGLGPLFMNIDVQQFDGSSYLTYFNGTGTGNHAYGAVHMLDHTYSQAYRICLKPGNVVLSSAISGIECYADQHESQVTDRGTILLSLYNVTRTDLRSVGGQNDGWVLDCQFYEVDIKTSEIKFSWKSLDHLDTIPLNSTHYPITLENQTFGLSQLDPFDYFHINSVTLLPDGGYLVSSRHVWNVIKLNKAGEVEWILPGDHTGDYFSHIDPKLYFSWQHHARVSNYTNTSMLLHMHNNANSEVDLGKEPTSGLLMSLDNLSDPHKRSATLLRNITDPNDLLYSFAQGSYQPLPNGNVLLQHGFVPKLKEYLPSGKIAMTATFAYADFRANSYRGFRFPWTGKPNSPPKAKASAKTANGTTTGSRKLYMSWNGATEYDQWLVYTGSSSTDLKHAANVSRAGFETNYSLTGKSGYAQAKAAGKGTVLGETAIVPF